MNSCDPATVNDLATYISYACTMHRKMALGYLMPSDELPINIQWEVINRALVYAVKKRWGNAIAAIRSTLQVLDTNIPK